ncbi:MAG: cobyric acid synthase [Clostridia bacterium]|nr:cobyric acid synthase [Clostridia bacterium]MBQ9011015.1 cobyric acid synthase [Clostridia bacterium]
MRGKCLMIQGTASSVGKSVLCSALLRILHQDGMRVAPFKAQNMALNSYVTRDGLEMGRAQVTQAQAACVEPDIRMNPVLLKPTGDRRSQVIVDGRPIGSMTAMEYHLYKPGLRRHIHEVYESLERDYDCIILEGAGSPAEINLRDGDIVNMSMAEAADAPVILVGDINLGGVFASLLGTILLLEEQERARVKGVIINKFRGDVSILEPGLRMLESRIHVPVLGVVPYMDVELEDEDSITERFHQAVGQGDLKVSVLRLRHISNFTDFQALTLQPGVRVSYAKSPDDLADADIIILPGTKNTIEDLIDLRNRGLDEPIIRHARRGGTVIGICGGYQMLAERLLDPLHVESRVPEIAGLGLLDMAVTFSPEKQTLQSTGIIRCQGGWLSALNGQMLDGYEIHAGRNEPGPHAVPWLNIRGETDGLCNPAENVLGTYLHGLFDDGLFFSALKRHLRHESPAMDNPVQTMADFREHEFNRIADIVRASLDMDRIRQIIREDRP